GWRDRCLVECDAAIGSITGAGDVELVAGGDHRASGHLVLGERACLVRADDVYRAERLDGGQFTGDRVSACHLLHTKGQGYRDDRRQPFWYCRHCETYCR